LTKTDTWHFSAALFASLESLATFNQLIPACCTCWHQHQKVALAVYLGL